MSKKSLRRRIMVHNAGQNLIKEISVPVSLSPHPLAQIAIHHCSSRTMLSFITHFCVFPCVFDVLCMGTCLWIHKVIRVINCKMCKSQILDTTIRRPHIRHDVASRSYRLLDNSEQSCARSVRNGVHKDFACLTADSTKHPLLR